jgi:acyl carrier protein
MSDQHVLETLRKWIIEQVLDASVPTIEPDAPLLEWGILNSLSTTRLVGFIRDQFGVEVPPELLVGANFKDLNSITRLVVDIRDRDLSDHNDHSGR